MADDLFAQQESIKRRRALLDAMMVQNQQSPIVGAPQYGLPQALAKVAAAYVGDKRSRDLDAESSQNRQRYGQELGGELERVLAMRMGGPGQMGSVGDYEGAGGSMTPPTEANPRAAILAAMTSRFPELQAYGKAEMANLGKQEQENFGTTPQRDAQGRTFVAGNRGNVKFLSGVELPPEHMTVGDRVVRKDDPTRVSADYRETFSAPYQRDGDWYQKDSRGKEFKLDNAPKISVSNNTTVSGKGESKFIEKLGEARAKQFTDAEEAAVTGYRAKSTVAQMKELDAKGVLSGPLANVATTLGALADSVGIPVDKAKLANSEAFQQQFAKQLAAVMLNGSIGRSMTDADRQRFEQSLPQLISTPQGRAQVYAMIEADAETNISRFNSMQQELQRLYPNEAMFNFNLADRVPGPRGTQPAMAPVVRGSPAPNSAPIPLQDYLKQRRGQ